MQKLNQPLHFRWDASRRRAFTLTELVVIIGVLGIVSVVWLPSWLANQEHVLRAKCLNQLRQVGAGISIYAAESNEFVPICGWPQGQNPWQTYPAARVVPGTSSLTRGYYSLGLLFRTRVVPDPRSLYCPGLGRNGSVWGYDYYRTPPNLWPSTPVGSGDEQIRTSYSYYPQLRATTPVVSYTLPRLTYSSVTLEVGGTFSLVTPAKLMELNPNLSIATDLVHNLGVVAHQAHGSIGGVNALFPSGGVTFQNPQHNPEAFNPDLWGTQASPNYIGNDPVKFRYVMSLWQP